MVNFNFKQRYNIDDLLFIMDILRAPGGCPWDAEQTHKSIRSDFIEEVYEAIEAIDTDNSVLLREELGDVLLQIVFHSKIEDEAGSFNFDDVVNDICQKLIIRHPHVFGDVSVSGTADVLKNWDAIKKKTKSQSTQTDVLKSVSPALPALMRSYKVQHKAAKVGFDWPDVSGALDKLSEEIDELREAIASGDESARAEEFGDVLFSAVNVSRFIGVEPEKALFDATEKFISRFEKVEQYATEQGIDMKEESLDTLNSLWDKAKQNM